MPLTRFQASLLRLRNRIDYPLRQFFHWQRGGYRPRSAAKTGLYAFLTGDSREKAEALAQRYRHDYDLELLYADSTPGAYREALFYLDMLVTALDRSQAALPDPLEAADIGPSTWFYVQALYAGLRGWNTSHRRRVFLTGFEADPYRVYNDLYSRRDHALGNMHGLNGVTYRPEAFTRQPGAFDLITLFFPFVFEDDHLEWGLPSSLFQPQHLLSDAWDSLKPGGSLLIVNQGPDEHRAQTQMLAQLGVTPLCAYRQDDLLFHYDLDRYVLVARRD